MIIFILILIILLIILFLYVNYFLELAISSKKDKGNILSKNRNKNLPFPSSNDENFITSLNNIKKEYTCKSSFDSIRLHYYIITNSKIITNKYIFLVHGFNNSHKSLGHFAKIFYDLGYNLVLLDLRGHGKSKAKYYGMGILDARDLLDVLTSFNKKYNDSSISLFGISMGAATVLSSLNLNLPNNVKCVIEDSGYTSAMDEFKYQAKRNFHVPKFAVYLLDALAKIKASYSFKDISPLDGVKKTTLPILFIHGKDDLFVPFEMGKKLYDSCNSEKIFLSDNNISHVQFAYINRELYLNTCKNFLEKYLK